MSRVAQRACRLRSQIAAVVERRERKGDAAESVSCDVERGIAGGASGGGVIDSAVVDHGRDRLAHSASVGEGRGIANLARQVCFVLQTVSQLQVHAQAGTVEEEAWVAGGAGGLRADEAVLERVGANQEGGVRRTGG